MDEGIRMLLSLEEAAIGEGYGKDVKLSGAINLHKSEDYDVHICYGDLVLIICMLKDYIRKLSEHERTYYWEYYLQKFSAIADSLSKQIDYDYEKAVERCLKRAKKEQNDGNVGIDAMELVGRR